jgi:hypothetical protein
MSIWPGNLDKTIVFDMKDGHTKLVAEAMKGSQFPANDG